jgi:diguanylate cyclase (GGDEF)-like protein/putative nucleotidyltransferase with HDIG domain
MGHQQLPSWGRLYVSAVVGLGGASILYSAYQLHARPIGWNWFILALLTLLSGSAAVKLPSVPATISISETFVVTSVLLFGPAAGTLTVTLDVLAISWWLARRGHPNYRIAFNVFALPASLWTAAQLFYALTDIEPLALSSESVQIATLLLPLIVFTISYFLLNSWLIAFAIYFETQKSPFDIWRNNFAWLSLNYFGGASVAALLVTYTRELDFTYLAFVVPLLAVLYFTFSMAMGRIEDANKHLSQLNKLYMSTIETLAMAIDAKDQITHGHIRRVQSYAMELARTLGVTEQSEISAIEAASLLHDMGKLAVPEYILNKPGPLTPAEFEKMKMHASVGADILSAIEFPYPVVPIVRHHHESWDGTGYPDGLVGSEIPVGARILAVVDCFDALTSDRPYRPRLTDKEALRILIDRRGTMYDPLIVDTFVRVHRQIAPPELQGAMTGSLRKITELSTPGSDQIVPSTRLEEISASTDEMLTLFDLARSVSPSMNASDIADIISKHVRRLIPCSLCVFYVFDQDADELLAAHVAGDQSGIVAGLRIPRGQRLSGWVAANRQTIRNSDPVLDFGESARAMTPRPRSCLSTPLLASTDLVGVLTLYSSNRDGFSADHERVVEIVARQVAPVLKMAGEFAAERAEVFRDEMTGLPNIEQFLQFSKSAQQSGGAIAPAALLAFDIDNLTQINTEFGRRTGDAVVSHVVDIARRVLRPSDVLFRHEGDQFIAVLLHTTEATGASLAEQLTHTVATSRGKLPFSVAVSVALAVAPRDASDFEGLLAIASRRLLNRPPSADDSRSGGDRIH